MYKKYIVYSIYHTTVAILDLISASILAICQTHLDHIEVINTRLVWFPDRANHKMKLS